MEYGIQHRSIYLVPPDPEDLAWFFDAFDREEIWSMFGYPGPSKDLIQERHATGNLIVGIIKKVEGEQRVGFAVEFPPAPPLNAWEFGIAIPNPRHRDLKSAIEAGDAWGHYFFDHLRIENGGWRSRADNLPSIALARRMGFRPYAIWEVGGVRFQFFRMNRERWQQRLAQLEEEEERFPSGQDQLFVTLREPPYRPVVVALSES